MKFYKGYKEIEIKDIKGVKYNRICNINLEKVCRYMETIKRNGNSAMKIINTVKNASEIFFLLRLNIIIFSL